MEGQYLPNSTNFKARTMSAVKVGTKDAMEGQKGTAVVDHNLP